MKNQTRTSELTKRMTGVAAFSALAYGVSLVTNIKVGFLSFDAKDAIITIASFIYGPVSAVAMSFITAFIEFISFGSTGPWGALMDFVSTFSFTFTASLIYKYRRKLSGALISLGTASAVYVAVMMIANLLITPLYMGVGVEAVKSLIPTMLLPFNIAKALMNSAIAMLIYKPVSRLIRRIGLAKPSEGKGASSRKDTVIILSVAAVILIAAVVIFIILRK
ncbi:MAG: ECF transporter S component [Clostridia bacterium]|nr:ECF transporter S component [Clostridia bacterium]